MDCYNFVNISSISVTKKLIEIDRLGQLIAAPNCRNSFSSILTCMTVSFCKYLKQGVKLRNSATYLAYYVSNWIRYCANY